MWQDTVIALCQLAFVPAMIPTLVGKDKPAFTTSLFNAVLVVIIGSTLATLHLWMAVATAGLIALIWAILAVQKFRIDRKAK